MIVLDNITNSINSEEYTCNYLNSIQKDFSCTEAQKQIDMDVYFQITPFLCISMCVSSNWD